MPNDSRLNRYAALNSDDKPPGAILQRWWQFSHRVLHKFVRNHGVLLAGGVGYNVLLSAVPLLALLGVLLTQVVDEEQLLQVMAMQAQHFAPAHAGLWLDAVRAFMDSRDIIGLAGIPVLLFFSSFAFRMLEDAIAIIFMRPENPRRSIWYSAVLPYAFILVMGIGLLALTLLFALVNALYEVPGFILYLLSFLSVFIMFSAIYKVLPTLRISPRRAVIGGLVAAILWEATRLIMMYYFLNISFVNVIYGSLATIIVLLISLEVGSIILLLGAQVIAELELSERDGLPWHACPDSPVQPGRAMSKIARAGGSPAFRENSTAMGTFDAMTQSRQYRVTGTVQGVSYRAATHDKARELGLNGWVRNRTDGSVEVLASGAPDALQKLEDWLWQGPERARVTAVTSTKDASAPPEGFEVRD